MVTYYGVELVKAQQEINETKGCHDIFLFLVKLHEDHVVVVVDAMSDVSRVTYHRACALRS